MDTTWDSTRCRQWDNDNKYGTIYLRRGNVEASIDAIILGPDLGMESYYA